MGSSTECCIFFALLLIPHSVMSDIHLISGYKGNSVTGLLGSSVNFSWSFSNGTKGVWGVLFGLIKDHRARDFIPNGILVAFGESGSPESVPVPVRYNGRVSGSYDGNTSTVHAIFTLSSIEKDDERFFGCRVSPQYSFDAEVFDSVYLNVAETPNITHPMANAVSDNEGRLVNISCRATGNPDPDVRWIHNGKVTSSGARTAELIFGKVGKEDTGMYICEANNSFGRTEKQLYFKVNYPATIDNITSSMAKAWIGQTVTLICKADGVPMPTLSWYKPDGTKFNEVKAYESTAVLTMNTEHDFGLYNCTADNGFPLASKMIQVKQIKAPSLPNIAIDVQATSMTVKWTVPADNGGSPITAYRVVLSQRDTEIDEKNVTDPVTKTCVFAGLRKRTIYSLRVSARNFVFEGPFSQVTVQTKPEGVPEAALIKDLPPETKDVTVKLTWDEPQNNGAPITKYTVYQRIVNNSSATREWTKIRIITDVSVREVAVKLEKDREYEFLVTASNRFGESVKEEKYTRKISAVGDVPASVEITDEIILYWDEPDSNGAAITRYSIYQRVGNEWKLIGVINDISKREYVVEIEKGKVYEFVVTATNKYGESSLEENIKWIQALSGSNPAGNQTGSVRSSEGLLHGVYVSCILLLLIFTFTLIFFIWKMRLRLELTNSRRKINKVKGKEFVDMEPIATQDEPVTQPSSTMEYDVVVTSDTPGSGDYMPLHPSRRSWEITRQQVNIIKVIGKGAFSEVAKATLWNLRENQKVITVAAKMLRANAPDSDRKDLLSELELMKKLKPHPHVIKLMACVTETDPLLVLIEFVPFGDLLGYLRKSRGLSDTYFEDPDVKPQTSLTAEQLMKFAWQVADGMCYLSSRKIIHRDLAARNVLVGEGETCKVTDFGMARNVQGDDIYSKKSRGRLPVKWTAYEALLYGVYTTQSDVWSYGILLYEILTVGGSPYPDVNARQIADRLQEGYRMPRPKHVDDTLYQLMLKCWEEQPTDRPTFNKLRKTMKEMEKKHKTYVNLSQYDNRLYANGDDLIEEEQDEVKSRSATQF